MTRIVIVEDEVFIREELAHMLTQAGYQTLLIEDFSSTSDQIIKLAPDLVLLDLNLPEESGFQVCRQVKAKTAIPILVLTSRDGLRDEIYALNLGADEYLTKPFRKERLLARIANLLRRYEGRPKLLEGADLALDPNTYTLYHGGLSTILPQNQGKILEAFLTDERGFASKEDLFMTLWGTTDYVDENALQVNIARLRRTLEELEVSYRVVALRGRGYMLEKMGDGNEA